MNRSAIDPPVAAHPPEEDGVSRGVARSIATSGWSASNVVWAITVACVWLWTCMQLSLDWRASANYQFGYAVPWVAIFLAWQRISMKPDCLAHDARRFPPAAVGLMLITAWCCLFFGEVLRELDPHWRFVSWVMTLGSTLLTLVWLHGRGGPKLLRQLAFPLAFAWMAVPWPTKVEDIITLRLRGLVTHVTVETLNALGISALQHGNVIDIASGAVSVDAPCAGIISLHSSLMVSLFLGECFRFTVKKRAILILAGSLIAMGTNLLRALALSLIVNAQGGAGMQAYHDPVGWMESALIVLMIFGVAWCMSSKSQARRAPTPAWRFFVSDAPAAPGAYASLLTFLSIPLLGWAWFALSPGGSVQMQKAPFWALQTTSTSAGWTVAPAAFTELDIQALQFSEGQKIDVRGPRGTQSGQIFHFFWSTGAITSPFCHTPDICMQRVGWKAKGKPIVKEMRIEGTDLPTKLYRFEQDSHEMVVFQAIYYGGAAISSSADFPEPTPNISLNASSRTSRLALLWGRPRRRGLEALNLYMTGSGNPEAETEAAQEVLDHVLRLNR